MQVILELLTLRGGTRSALERKNLVSRIFMKIELLPAMNQDDHSSPFSAEISANV